jgi:putative AdoMet-dependent methyltransferase
MLTLGYANSSEDQAFSWSVFSSADITIPRDFMIQQELAAQFDQWSATYDEELAAPHDTFPFAGYSRVLASVLDQANVDPGMNILDLGVGTGNLARLFVNAGCQVTGLDFSPMMLAKARVKLPGIELLQADLTSADWPEQMGKRYHRIVSNYTFHEFPLNTKVAILSRLARDHLFRNGVIVIGDILFPTLADLEIARQNAGDAWEEEFYWVTRETRRILEPTGWTMEVIQHTFCSGVYTLIPPVNET